MTFDQVMAELEARGTAQNRKIYRRHGAGDELFGVSFADLRKLAGKIKRDQQLAEALWASGNADARCLATMIADPTAFGSRQLDAWARDLDYYVVADLFSALVAKTRFARRKAERWTASRREYVAQAGWNLVAHLAMGDEPDDGFFRRQLERIEAGIDGAKNRVKHAMNGALIAIGGSRAALEGEAIAAARRIGKVEVDHGETGCKTPAAIPYIRKMAARRELKARRARG